MDRTPGGCSHLFSCRGKPDIFGSFIFRIVILVLNRHIQTDLKPAYAAVHAAHGNQKTGSYRGEIYRPTPVSPVKSRYAFYREAIVKQPLCKLPSLIEGRRAFVAKVFDLLVVQTTFGMQLLPVFLGKR